MIMIIAFLSAASILSSQPIDRLDPAQVFCIATAVYHEARGEPVLGQSAVAHVVLNRVNDPKYPDTPCEVIYQPWQFSYIEKASPDYNSLAWGEAIEAAVFAYAGIVDDPTGGALNYYAHRLVKPSWASSGIVTARIDGHTFMLLD
jgi:N-acetylmuramoyl-L-alanine amidase